MKTGRLPPDFADLRRAAEAEIGSGSSAEATHGYSTRLVHELRVHRLELEMQNEELKRAQADTEAALKLYTDLYDHAPVGYFTLDAAGAILRLNLAAARLLGGERSQLVSWAFQRFVAPQDQHRLGDFLHQLIFRRQPAACELPLAGVEPRWLLLEATPDEGAQTCSVVAVDISARKAAEAALRASEERERQARAAADRANQAKTRFLAATSQELSGPLTNLVVTANLLASNLAGNLTADQVNLAAMIAESGNDLRHLVDDLLDLAAIESGTLTVQAKTVAFPDLLAGIRRVYPAMAQRKGLTFGVAIDADVPAALITDPVRLQQILRSLLGNAIKFTQEGGVSLRIRLAGDEAPAIAFDVVDTGIGMSPRQQEGIFRIDHPETGHSGQRFDRAGLGLPIVRELAELLGGRLEVASAPGNGSTFTFLLPLEHHSGEN